MTVGEELVPESIANLKAACWHRLVGSSCHLMLPVLATPSWPSYPSYKQTSIAAEKKVSKLFTFFNYLLEIVFTQLPIKFSLEEI